MSKNLFQRKSTLLSIFKPKLRYFQRFFSNDSHKQESKRIRKELRDRVAQGPFFKAGASATSLGDKPFPTSRSLFSETLAKDLTPFSMKNLQGDEMQVPSPHPTMLCVAYNQHAFSMLSTWTYPLDLPFTVTGLNYVTLSVVENWLLSKMPGMLESSLRKSVESYLYENTGVYCGSFESYAKELGITNQLLAYVYLIDENGKIRWRGCGEAGEEDVARLEQGLRDLNVSFNQ